MTDTDRSKLKSEVLQGIPKKHREAVLDRIFEVYVDRQGLGAIHKQDFDALLVYLYSKFAHDDKFDVFLLGEELKLSEARVKSLYQTGFLKFGDTSEAEAWVSISEQISKSRFEVDSIEKEQIRFKLENPGHYRFLQNRVRKLGGTVSYAKSSEIVTISLSTLADSLEAVSDLSESKMPTKHLDEIQKGVKRTVNQIAKTLGKEKLKKLSGKKNHLANALDKLAKLAGIASGIAAFI